MQVDSHHSFRSNILINCHYEAKLGDFGFSLQMPDMKDGKTLLTCPLVAFSQGYSAPEVSEGYYTQTINTCL